MSLTDFLLARIAEDVTWVRRWEDAYAEMLSDGVVANPQDKGWYTADYLFEKVPVLDYDEAEHIGKWSPARVLAECEAKRQIVEAALNAAGRTREGYADYAIAHMWSVKVLALPYADHPDYDESWRP